MKPSEDFEKYDPMELVFFSFLKDERENYCEKISFSMEVLLVRKIDFVEESPWIKKI